MPYKIITSCPVCGNRLKAIKLKCFKCGTIIENDFELSKFSYLTKGELDFIEVFMKCRGNIKDVEKELGISYPTVRAKLDDVITALGYAVERKAASDSSEVLEKLEKGEITAEEAVNLLKE